MDLEIPTGFSSIEKNVNDIITGHNDWVENIESKQKKRYEKIKITLCRLKVKRRRGV